MMRLAPARLTTVPTISGSVPHSALHRKQEAWTSERHALLEKFWADGDSATVIARKINSETGSEFSRNSIIGKVNREGLPKRKSIHTARKTGPRGPRLVKPIRQKKFNPQPSFDRDGITDLPSLANEPEFLGIALLPLTADQCHYPHGDCPDMTFCGQPVQEGSSYCEFHHHVTHQRPQPRPAQTFRARAA